MSVEFNKGSLKSGISVVTRNMDIVDNIEYMIFNEDKMYHRSTWEIIGNKWDNINLLEKMLI